MASEQPEKESSKETPVSPRVKRAKVDSPETEEERVLDLKPTTKPTASDNDKKLEALWTSVKCKDLIKKQTITTIDSKDTVLQALEALAKHGVSSAPIWSKEESVLCGIFDYRDLGAVLIKAFASKESEKFSTFKAVLDHHSADLSSDLSGHDKFYSVNTDATLFNAVEFFGQGLHRVTVLDEKKHLAGIISQSDALTYFYTKLKAGELDFLKNKTLDELKIITTKVYSVDENASVFDALKIMHEHGLSSVAITKAEGSNIISANLSMADIKYLVQLDKMIALRLPIKKFIQEVRIAKDRENDFKTVLPVFVVTKDSTLEQTCGRLVATRTHRVWVVKSATDHSLYGVVSLSDILHRLTPTSSQTGWKHHPFINFIPSH